MTFHLEWVEIPGTTFGTIYASVIGTDDKPLTANVRWTSLNLYPNAIVYSHMNIQHRLLENPPVLKAVILAAISALETNQPSPMDHPEPMSRQD